ncbi:MAG: large subunit ribosomal protein L35 [Candidatus Deianiraeaceae bacterium]|jgi:large subunit ribosomal protein L35
MPKLKTKSSAKKRFKFSASGLVIRYAAKRRHNQGNRCRKALRQSKGPITAKPEVAKIIKKYLFQ